MTTTLRNADILFNDSTTQGTAGPSGAWNNVTSSRALSTTYTNSRSKIMLVSVSGVIQTGGGITLNVSGVTVGQLGASTVAIRVQGYFAVPSGATYSVGDLGSYSLAQWFEYY